MKNMFVTVEKNHGYSLKLPLTYAIGFFWNIFPLLYSTDSFKVGFQKTLWAFSSTKYFFTQNAYQVMWDPVSLVIRVIEKKLFYLKRFEFRCKQKLVLIIKFKIVCPMNMNKYCFICEYNTELNIYFVLRNTDKVMWDLVDFSGISNENLKNLKKRKRMVFLEFQVL